MNLLLLIKSLKLCKLYIIELRGCSSSCDADACIMVTKLCFAMASLKSMLPDTSTI